MSSVAIVLVGCSGGGAPSSAGDDAPGAGPDITIKQESAALVAFQDGDGDWTALQGNANVYRATASRSHYAIASVCASGAVTLYYQTVSDPSELDLLSCSASPVPSELMVTVETTGFDAQAQRTIYLGSQSTFEGAGDNDRVIQVLPGLTDVFVSSYTQPDQGDLVLYRGAPVDLERSQLLQIAGNSALPPEVHAVTVSGLEATDSVDINSAYRTPRSGDPTSIPWNLPSHSFDPGTAMSYSTIDASLREPGDLTEVTATTSRTGPDGVMYYRQTQLTIADAETETLAMPAEFVVTAEPTVDTAADPRVSMSIPTADGILPIVAYSAGFFTGTLPDTRSLLINITASWATGQTSLDIATPDLSSLSGWPKDVALDSTQPLQWILQRSETDTGFPVSGPGHAINTWATKQEPQGQSTTRRMLDLRRPLPR